MVPAVVRKMLKTRVTLGNISHVLLKIDIGNIQRLLPPPNVHTVSIHISSLVHQARLLLALTFFLLPCLDTTLS